MTKTCNIQQLVRVLYFDYWHAHKKAMNGCGDSVTCAQSVAFGAWFLSFCNEN
jgi:hypothetical protein